MAKKLVVAIHDRQINAFNNPFYVASRGHANRMFGDEVNRADEHNQMYKHPEDFALFELGTFDEQTGIFENHNERISLATDHVKGNGNA